MQPPSDELRQSWIHRLSPRHLGLVGQTSASWGVAGGLVAAMVTCGHILAGSVSSSVAFFTATVFFAAGATAGFLHGGLLSYFGRPAHVPRRRAVARVVLAAAYSVPVLTVGWFVAMLLVLSALALRAEQYLAFTAGLLGWGAAGVFLIWAGVETSRTVQHLFRRWPDARAMLAALLLASLALFPLFVIARPEIWVLGVRPTATTAAAMALLATIWLAGPVVVIAFLALRAWRRSHPRPGTTAGSSVGP